MNIRDVTILKRVDMLKKHVYGEGIFDTIKAVLGKTAKNVATKAGEKAGVKIIKLLKKKKKTEMPPPLMEKKNEMPTLADYEVNERVNRLPSGGKFK